MTKGDEYFAVINAGKDFKLKQKKNEMWSAGGNG